MEEKRRAIHGMRNEEKKPEKGKDRVRAESVRKEKTKTKKESTQRGEECINENQRKWEVRQTKGTGKMMMKQVKGEEKVIRW